MCSIAGSVIPEEVPQMLQTMKHRSPDGVNHWGDKKFTIGMGRLSIIDLESTGLCLYEEDGVRLAFNGEIYNYIELRDELKKKYTFRTQSDTEVVYKAWKEWGVDCFAKFNGMFALAIYDGRTVVLARDIAGEKPLYIRDKEFAFASEAKALGFGCEQLPRAHYAVYDVRQKACAVKEYWELKKRDIDLKTAQDELEWLLEDSVRLRTRSDVPYGLYLSGGIDSSLIATYHDFQHTFTYDDGDYKEEYLNTIEKILWHLDYPISSFSPFGLWKLAEMASQKVKVVLSGEGADELFGGYVRYLPNELNRQAQKLYPSYTKIFPYAEDVNEMGWNEFNGNMQELLRMGDRMASAFGIENRCPFLDRRIIEFAYSLPPEMKVQGFEMKVILRRILEKRNPKYQHIEKSGLYCSSNSWIGEKNKFAKSKYMWFQKRIWKKLASSAPTGRSTKNDL